MTTYYCFSWHGWLQTWDRAITRDDLAAALADPNGKELEHADKTERYSPATGVLLAIPRPPGGIITMDTPMRVITAYRVKRRNIKARWSK